MSETSGITNRVPRSSPRAADEGSAKRRGEVTAMTIEIVVVEEITATRIHLDPEAGGA